MKRRAKRMSRKGKALERKKKALKKKAAKLAKEKAKMENTTNATTTTTTIESGKYKGYSVGYSRGREYADNRFKTCTHDTLEVRQIGDLTLFYTTKSTIDFDTMRNKDLMLNDSDVLIFNSAQQQQRWF